MGEHLKNINYKEKIRGKNVGEIWSVFKTLKDIYETVEQYMYKTRKETESHYGGLII